MVLLALGGEGEREGERKGRGVIGMVLDLNVHLADLSDYSRTLLGTSCFHVFPTFFPDSHPHKTQMLFQGVENYSGLPTISEQPWYGQWLWDYTKLIY